MTVFSPDRSDSIPATPQTGWVVACLCAAWCDTCTQYSQKFAALADQRKDTLFAWIDIEDHPEYLGDEDVENFPTVLIQRDGRSYFFGPMLPHIGHLERLLDALDENAAPIDAGTVADVHALLRAHTT